MTCYQIVLVTQKTTAPLTMSVGVVHWLCKWLSELQCSRLEDEVVMGREEVDLHRLHHESGLTQLTYSLQLTAP